MNTGPGGVQRNANSDEARIFKTLAGRNAINLHPATFATEVVLATDAAGTLRRCFEELRTRSDALPFGEAAAALTPPVVSPGAADPDGERRALLIIGSPKTASPSSSSVLGSYLLEQLGNRGWETEALTLRANLFREEGEAALLASIDRAALILFVFPLYVDALPCLATKALAVIAAHRRGLADARRQRLVAIVNSGFPESYQNALALAICREFAAQSGIGWDGGLAIGGGGIIGVEPLSAAGRSGPPMRHLIRALDLTAEALSEGRPVPAEAVQLAAKCPVPLIPAAVWRRLYIQLGGRRFVQEAAKNGVSADRLMDRPYASLPSN